MTLGEINELFPLTITTHMSDNGIIFNDAIEADYCNVIQVQAPRSV